MHSFYEKQGYAEADFPVAAATFKQILSLPIFPSMSDTDVQVVIDAVLELETELE